MEKLYLIARLSISRCYVRLSKKTRMNYALSSLIKLYNFVAKVRYLQLFQSRLFRSISPQLYLIFILHHLVSLASFHTILQSFCTGAMQKHVDIFRIFIEVNNSNLHQIVVPYYVLTLRLLLQWPFFFHPLPCGASPFITRVKEVVLLLDSNKTSESVSVSEISLFATVTELFGYNDALRYTHEIILSCHM